LVFRTIRETVIPLLATFPNIRVWLAGCASGEEAWSLAILLHEANLLHRCQLYATDMNTELLANARVGIFPLSTMQENTRNYIGAGGGDFSRYYTAAYDSVKFDPALARSTVFAQHNLAVDQSFNEFHLILCRNVMIYFDDQLHARVHELLYNSLAHLGVLCLGTTESLQGTPRATAYESLVANQPLYRKKQHGTRTSRIQASNA
jgi:chemotaxis protein methyltransferase CheR